MNDETKPKHGGARLNAGRKLESGDPAKRTSVTIDDLTKRKLVVLGDGNMSLGIRRAADFAYDRYQRGLPVTRAVEQV